MDASSPPRSLSLAGPWLALLVLAIPIATAGALCSLVAPYWVVDIDAGLSAKLEQRWLFVVPVRSRDLGVLDRVELAFEEVKRPGPPRVGGGEKEGSYRLVLHHNGDRRTELPAGKAESAASKLEGLLTGDSPVPASVWIGKPILGLWAPLVLLGFAAASVATFFVRLLRRS
ncbi:MAG: hypothetical protein AAGM22_05490 [Acidobacteriota bacterium]